MRKPVFMLLCAISCGPGPAGPPGPQGEPGATGMMGIAGERGATGAQGVTGATEAQYVLKMANELRASYGSSVLDIWCYVGPDPVGFGTGTKTKQGTIITAHHVVESCDGAHYWSGPLDVGGGGTFTQFGGIDLVEIKGVNWTPYGASLPGVEPAFNVLPLLGEAVFALSFPGSFRNDVQVTYGYVVDDNTAASSPSPSYWFKAFTTDYAATGGSSGAPVFINGKWVAIHVGGFSSTTINDGLELNYSLPLQK